LEIVISANLRGYRHIFAVRRHPRADRETRRICPEMPWMVKGETPIVFREYEIDEANQCVNITED